MDSFEYIGFKSLIAKETNGRMRVRLMAISQVTSGINNTQTAKNLNVSRYIVNNWVRKFYDQGLDGLKDKPRSGRPCSLNKQQLSQLSLYIHDNSIKSEDLRYKHIWLILLKSLMSTIQLIIFIGFYIN